MIFNTLSNSNKIYDLVNWFITLMMKKMIFYSVIYFLDINLISQPNNNLGVYDITTVKYAE